MFIRWKLVTFFFFSSVSCVSSCNLFLIKFKIRIETIMYIVYPENSTLWISKYVFIRLYMREWCRFLPEVDFQPFQYMFCIICVQCCWLFLNKKELMLFLKNLCFHFCNRLLKSDSASGACHKHLCYNSCGQWRGDNPPRVRPGKILPHLARGLSQSQQEKRGTLW